tara:strand:+ start:1007 stop:1243 length:237 start_codon:yes stop_codon:yes gene_type:complete
MGLRNILTSTGSPLSKANGATPPTPIGATAQSKLQDTYSINGNPNVPNKPSPSQLDLNGGTPTNQYRNTAPAEGIGRI